MEGKDISFKYYIETLCVAYTVPIHIHNFASTISLQDCQEKSPSSHKATQYSLKN